MLSVLAYKLRSKSGVVKMLTTDPDVININMNGGFVAVRSPHRQRLGNQTPILPDLGFTDGDKE